MKRIMIAIASAVAVGFSVCAGTPTSWLNANINNYTSWPPSSEGILGGEWAVNATAEVAIEGTAPDAAINVSADAAEPLTFAAYDPKALSSVKSVTFNSKATFEPFKSTALPAVPADAKVGVILVTNGETANYYVIDGDSEGGTNFWTEATTATVGSPVEIAVTVAGGEVTYVFDGDTGLAKTVHPIMGATPSISAAAISGDGVVAEIRASYELDTVTVSGATALANATYVISNNNQAITLPCVVARNSDVIVTYTAAAGYLFADGKNWKSVTKQAATDGVIDTGLTDADVIQAEALKNGTQYYLTLQEAFNAAADGDTIALCKATAFAPEGMYTIPATLTLDLKGYSLTGNGGKTFEVINNKTLTINATDSTVTGVRINVGKAGNNNGNLVITGGSWSIQNNTLVHVNGECQDSDVTITGATMVSDGDNGIQLNGSGTFALNDVDITGATAVYMKGGSLTIANGTFCGIGDADYVESYNGANATGDAIVFDKVSSTSGYANNLTVKITGGTFKSDNRAPVASYAMTGATPIAHFIEGGSFYGPYWTPDNKLAKEGSTFEEDTSKDPGWYKLASAGAKIGTKYYLTLKEALDDVKAGDTVELLTAATIGDALSFDKSCTIELNGQVFTANGAIAVAGEATIKLVNKTFDPAQPLLGGQGKFAPNAQISVAAGATIDLSSLPFGTTYGGIEGAGNLKLASGGVAKFYKWTVPMVDSANWMFYNYPAFFADSEIPVGGIVYIGETKWTGKANHFALDDEAATAYVKANHNIGSDYSEFTHIESFATLAAAAAANGTGDVTLYKAGELAAIAKATTVDLNGFDMTLSGSSLDADLTVKGASGKLIANGAKAVNGDLDLSALNYKTQLAGNNGSFAIAAGKTLKLPVPQSVKTLAAMGMFAGSADGAMVVTADGKATYDGIAWMKDGETPWATDLDGNFLIAKPADITLLKDYIALNKYTTGSFKQTADIDMTGIFWPGIGSTANTASAEGNFAGTYDGGNFAITNVKFTNRTYAGFFNITFGATIQNLTINVAGFENPDATDKFGGAAFVGQACAGCVFRNLTSKGSFGTVKHNTAGIAVKIGVNTAGFLDKTYLVENCTNEINLATTYTKAAGIAAFSQRTSYATIAENPILYVNCVNKGSITMAGATIDGAGGIVAWQGDNLAFSNCVSKGEIYVTGGAAWTTVGSITGGGNSESKAYSLGGNVTTLTNLPAVAGSGNIAVAPSDRYAYKVFDFTYAEIDGAGIATFVADSAAKAGADLKVMLNAQYGTTLPLAAGESVTLDTSISATTVTITVPDNCRLVRNGNVYTAELLMPKALVVENPTAAAYGALDAAYTFTADGECPPKPVADKNVDYVVTFDKDIDAGAVRLAAVMETGWTNFPAMKFTAGTPYPLLTSMKKTLSVAEMYAMGSFTCGISNINVKADTTMTVQLVMNDTPVPYVITNVTYTIKAKSVDPVTPGTEIVVPAGKKTEDFAQDITTNTAMKAQYLKAPGTETTGLYLDCFDAIPAGSGKVMFVLNETGTNAVELATTAANTGALDAALDSKATAVTIAEPLVGFYYSFKQGGDVTNLGFNKSADQDVLATSDGVSFDLVKPEGAGFYQTIVTPKPTK